MAPSRGCALLTGSAAYLRFSSNSYLPRVILPATRSLASTPIFGSGHNRWSKIKHDKAKVDSAKNSQRSQFAKELTLASKLFGPDPALNPRLADLITKAKREGFAKASIEAAIARGQGRSTHGAALESVLVEGILPGNVACMVECETDHRLRTLQEVRLVLKNAGGVTSPISYLFKKVGRVVFEGKEGVGSDEALEPALEAGATDVWEVASSSGDNAPRIAVSAEPAETKAVADQVSKVLDLTIATSDILWEPEQQTVVELESDKAAHELIAVIDELLDKETSVQAIAMNVAQGAVSSQTWNELQSRLSS